MADTEESASDELQVVSSALETVTAPSTEAEEKKAEGEEVKLVKELSFDSEKEVFKTPEREFPPEVKLPEQKQPEKKLDVSKQQPEKKSPAKESVQTQPQQKTPVQQQPKESKEAAKPEVAPEVKEPVVEPPVSNGKLETSSIKTVQVHKESKSATVLQSEKQDSDIASVDHTKVSLIHNQFDNVVVGVQVNLGVDDEMSRRYTSSSSRAGEFTCLLRSC